MNDYDPDDIVLYGCYVAMMVWFLLAMFDIV